MRVWLWDAGRYHGVTDDEARAMDRAEASLRHGGLAHVELALVIPSIRYVTWRYIRTGAGWTGTNVGGSVAWRPLLCADHQFPPVPGPHSTPTEGADMEEDGLFAFERVYLEKLRLAGQVLLGLAQEQFISDPLESELHGLQDRVERVLLLPERAAM
jgi:hypothetical protein